jgi:hypothetical protein
LPPVTEIRHRIGCWCGRMQTPLRQVEITKKHCPAQSEAVFVFSKFFRAGNRCWGVSTNAIDQRQTND